jgi:hypothetical protein
MKNQIEYSGNVYLLLLYYPFYAERVIVIFFHDRILSILFNMMQDFRNNYLLTN